MQLGAQRGLYLVESALKDDALTLARFRQAEPYKGVESGIPYGRLAGDARSARRKEESPHPMADA
jgi:hypothetical protein